MKRKNKSKLYLSIFYTISIVILAIFGILHTSFFAYNIMDLPIFSRISFSIYMLLLLVRGTEMYLRQNHTFGKFFIASFYGSIMCILGLREFIPFDIWLLCLLALFYFLTTLLIIMSFKKKGHSKTYYDITRFEPVLAVLLALLLLLVMNNQSYINHNMIWLPIVISGVILAVPSVLVFIKYFSKIDYFTNQKSELIFSYILLVASCFYVTAVTIGTINYSFADEPSPIEVEIVDKYISSGYRRVTLFYFVITIDGKEEQITVPVDIYHEKEIGELTEIQFYEGALGYAYYIFEYYE